MVNSGISWSPVNNSIDVLVVVRRWVFFFDFCDFCVVAPEVGWSLRHRGQVIQAYETEGFSMLLRVFNETAYLEQLTGLDKLYEESEAALADVEWDEDNRGSGEDDF